MSAAAAIFAERGFESATTRAIAERAGYSEALIQNYFNGKEGLLLAVMAREMGDGAEQAGFFDRPLCAAIAVDVRETLLHIAASLRLRATRLRIVLSRVFIDPQFKVEYGRLTYRRVFEAKLRGRLDRYAAAGLLDGAADRGALTEMVICLGFELGFIHPDVLDTPPAVVDGLVDGFAAIVGRAFPPAAAQ